MLFALRAFVFDGMMDVLQIFVLLIFFVRSDDGAFSFMRQLIDLETRLSAFQPRSWKSTEPKNEKLVKRRKVLDRTRTVTLVT